MVKNEFLRNIALFIGKKIHSQWLKNNLMKNKLNEQNCKKAIWQNEPDPGTGILSISETKGTGSAPAGINIRKEISDGQFTGKRYCRKSGN